MGRDGGPRPRTGYRHSTAGRRPATGGRSGRSPVPPSPEFAEGAGGWVRTPIDAFVLAKLRESKGLGPSPEADRRTLIRRLSFDLTGLPPTPEEVDAFVDDAAARRLRAAGRPAARQPHYGERWARHWMDLVHFAETHGHDQDRVRPNAWPYRDYLIESFNRDTPYARFVQEQLAGRRPLPRRAAARRSALGFIAAGPWDESSLRDIREDSIDRQIGHYLDRDDMVATAMSTFVSTTVHCARCHDHKFDPIRRRTITASRPSSPGVDRADRPTTPTRGRTASAQALTARQKALPAPRPGRCWPRCSTPSIQSEVAAWEADAAEPSRRPGRCSTPIGLESAARGRRSPKQPDGSILAGGTAPPTRHVHDHRPRPTRRDHRRPARGPARRRACRSAGRAGTTTATCT